MAEAPWWANDIAALLALTGTIGAMDAGYAILADVQSAYEQAYHLTPGSARVAEGLVALAALLGAYWLVLKYEDHR